MRVEFGLSAMLLALAGAAALAAAAPPDAAKKAGAVQAAPDLNAARRPTGAQQSNPATGTVALTAAECTSLGGRVHDAMPGVCKSNQFCAVTDNFGHTHATCLTAQ